VWTGVNECRAGPGRQVTQERPSAPIQPVEAMKYSIRGTSSSASLEMSESSQEALIWTLQPFRFLPKCYLLSDVFPKYPFKSFSNPTLLRQLSPSDKLIYYLFYLMIVSS
jgi:hypothetical protein